MTYIKKQADGTFEEFNFVAPEGKTAEEVLFPLGDVQEPAYAAAIAVDIEQMETFLQPEELTGNATINLTVNPQVTKGAKLYLKLDADLTDRTVTLGTGFDAAAADVVVPASGVEFKTYVYDGTAFVPADSTAYVAALIAALDARLTTAEGSITSIDARVTALEGAE